MIIITNNLYLQDDSSRPNPNVNSPFSNLERINNQNDEVLFQAMPASNQSSYGMPEKIPEINVIEPSLPSSLSSSPLKSDVEMDPEFFKIEQSNHLNVPSSSEESDEEEALEENDSIEAQKNKPTINETMPMQVSDQPNNGVFMGPRSYTLDDIHEEDSSEIDDYDYGNDSISDSASYDIAVHHKRG